MGYLFHCELSSFYRLSHNLNVHVYHDNENYHLVGYDIGVVQIVLDVRSLEKLENRLI